MQTHELEPRHEIVPVVFIFDPGVDEEVFEALEREGQDRSEPHLAQRLAEGVGDREPSQQQEQNREFVLHFLKQKQVVVIPRAGQRHHREQEEEKEQNQPREDVHVRGQ